jgi:hypothetical protein
MLSCGFSLISSKTLALGHSSLYVWELGSPLGTVDCPRGEDIPSGCSTFLSLSPEDLIFWGRLPYLSSGQASSWELDHPHSFRLPIGMSPGQPWAPLPNA